jgi:hypothetical protein
MDKTGLQPTLASLIPEDIDSGSVVITYDGDSDTLLIHFYGRGVPGVSVDAGGGAMLRMDRERKRVIGVHIEHFLSLFARDHPDVLDILDLAEVRDMSTDELAKIRREITTRHKDAILKRVIGDLHLGTAAD